MPLDLDSLLLTLKESTLSSKWYAFGEVLGVPKEFLEQLNDTPHNECLVEILDFWLRHHHSQPTWKEIMDAQQIVEANER